MTDFLTSLLNNDVSKILLNFLGHRDLFVLSFVSKNYRSFFQNYFQESIDKALKDELKKSLGKNLDAFLQVLHDSQSVISGSFVLQTVLQEKWTNGYNDVDIYTEVDNVSNKGYKYRRFTAIEEFFLYHCQQACLGHHESDEKLAWQYQEFCDVQEIRSYNVNKVGDDSLRRTIVDIYHAVQKGDKSTIKKHLNSFLNEYKPLVRSVEILEEKIKNLEHRIDPWEIAEEVFWFIQIYKSYHFLDEAGTIFQTIQKKCETDLVSNIYQSFDFDFCKIVAFVNDKGNFVVNAKNWDSIFNKSCRFPAKLPYGGKFIHGTVERYFKYASRGFDIYGADHVKIINHILKVSYYKHHSTPREIHEHHLTDCEFRGIKKYSYLNSVNIDNEHLLSLYIQAFEKRRCYLRQREIDMLNTIRTFASIDSKSKCK